MNENPFHSFIDLVTVDQEIRALHAKARVVDQAIADVRKQEHVLLESLEQAKNRALLARKDVDSRELEMKSLDQQQQDKKDRLENVTGHKEYQSIEKEIKLLQHKQSELEEHVLQAWNKLDSATKAYEALKTETATQQTVMHAAIAEHELKKSHYTKDIEAKEQARKGKEALAPAEWIEKYGIMRLKVDDPVVPVVDANCSACYYKIPGQDMIILARNKMLQCKSCYRLLYLSKS